jgi:hypothetical protein
MSSRSPRIWWDISWESFRSKFSAGGGWDCVVLLTDVGRGNHSSIRCRRTNRAVGIHLVRAPPTLGLGGYFTTILYR